MDPIRFCTWLRGYFEIAGETALTKEQATIISQHLALVFKETAKTLSPLGRQMTEKEIRDMMEKVQRGAGPLDPLDQVKCQQGPVVRSSVDDYDPLAFIDSPRYC